MEKLGKFVAAAVMVAISAAFYAWAVQTLWGWFVYPLTLAYLGYFNAWGLVIIGGCIMVYAARHDRNPPQPFAEQMLFTACKMAVTLFAMGIGAIVHHFMIAGGQ